ncbi:MAG: carboxypeptidase-like regulatory domain-containing protein, partial [Deltaproteobacteria bacterium]|nr:carboxypeptidase-like regulatory domain-containing protein [Deltaproteobacteria bacterium]
MGRSWRRWGVVAAGLVLLAAAGRADEAAETGGIRGRVVDAGSGAGLPAATVTVQDAGKTAVTGGDGAFEIGGIPPGSHTVVCSRAGYQTRKVVVSVSAGRVVELTCRLPAIVVKPDEKKVKDEARGDTAAPVAEPEAGERELLRMEAVPRKKASMGAGKAAPM